MIKLPGYEIIEKIHEGRRLTSFRARQGATQKTVVIKAAHHEANNYLIETGYKISRPLDPEMVVRPVAMESHNGLKFLILEDFGAKPLSSIQTEPLGMQDLLGLFIKISQSLFYIHDKSIIHNDINPENLWFNSTTHQLKISGFGLSKSKEDKTDAPLKDDMNQYAVEYMSPEQTGRTCLPITQATDFYSLGCTLYHLASGRVPFTSQDTLELIYCHLAKTPRKPHQINTDISEPLSLIIMKLLEKTPANRYQSCIGLQRDFEICLDAGNGKISSIPFLPGQHDLAPNLFFSKKLYGREKQIRILTQALTGENEADASLILISGGAGVGKSALVEQVCQQLGRPAYFITGKHDKISSRGTAQAAFESVTLQILGEGETKVREWKNKIMTAMGDNVQLIVDFIPMLNFIVGKQPPAPERNSIESDLRLNIVLRKFIETIASDAHPLILFLDDLQWVEPESIRILETIESHPIKGFYIICAYRDTETNENHPFIRTIRKIQKNRFPVLELHLTVLDLETQNVWVSDLFKNCVPDTQSLSGLLFEKTDGNPFFIKLFLEYLSNKKFLYQASPNAWKWDIKQIHALPVSDNVGDFMINKIHQLRFESIELLKLASCLGSSCSIRTLETIHGNKTSFRSDLDPVIKSGILIQNRDVLTFVHDIVRESVYALMQEQEQKSLHLRAGRRILAMTSETTVDEQIFIITDQMNAAISILSEPEDRINLSLLNLKAGQKKMEVSSLVAADRYFQTGIDLLPETAWNTNYKLSLSLFSHRCEILFVLGHYTAADHTFNQVLNHAELPDHLLKIFEAKSTYLMQSYKAQEVIDIGLGILSKLDYTLSSKFSRFRLYKEILLFKKQVSGKKISDLIHLPEITDPRQTSIIRILIIITRACAFNGHPFGQIALFKSLRFILNHGITPHSAYVFSFYGTVLSNLLYDVKKGYAFGKLAMDIVKKFNAKRQALLTHHLFIVMSINSLGQTRHHLNQLSGIVKNSLNSGFFMNIFNLQVMYFFLSFISGKKLVDMEKKMQESRISILESNQIVWLHNMELLFQTVRALMGKDRKLFLLDEPTDIYDEKLIQRWEKTNTIATISDYFLYHQMLSFFLQGGRKSLEFAKKGSHHFKSYVSLSSQMAHRFFYSLAILDQYNANSHGTKAVDLKQVRKNQKFFKMIYIQAPKNSPHLYFLLEAELARIKNRFKIASCYYDKAMASAKEEGHLHIEAICCELAGKFYLEERQIYSARFLISESSRLYREWGVLSKAHSIEKQYAALLTRNRPFRRKDNETIDFKDVDIYSVLKASQAISKEVKPKKLMKRLIQLIIENSGAQKAFLVINTDNQLRIEAFAQAHPDSIKILQGVSIEKNSKLLAAAVVYYSFLSRKSIILDNASEDKQFDYDPYICANKPVSILCTPIIGKKSIQGVLYLENNLMTGAFTKQRLRILDILITQVVISIENSKLYEKLRNEIKKQVLSARKIQTHQTQLRKLSSQLAQTEERERKSIADDLHDSVTQTLAMGISMLKSIKDPTGKDNSQKMIQTRNLLEQSLTNIRSLTFQLSSPILYDVGLEAALQWLCEDFFQKHGLQIRFINASNTVAPLDETIKISLYRAVRELMMNILKHAKTQNAVLSLSVRDHHFILCIEDNGIGFNTGMMNINDGFGLFSISERMRAFSGKIQIDSTPGKGTRIQIEVPLSDTARKNTV